MFQVVCPSEFDYQALALKVENKSDLSLGSWANMLTLGLQLSEQDRNSASSIGEIGFHPQGTDRKLGLYALGEFVQNDRLTLIPGVRVDFGDRSRRNLPALAHGADTSDKAISASLAAMYDLSDSLSVFGSLASTRRMPTQDELYSSGPQKVLQSSGNEELDEVALDHIRRSAPFPAPPPEAVERGYSFEFVSK